MASKELVPNEIFILRITHGFVSCNWIILLCIHCVGFGAVMAHTKGHWTLVGNARNRYVVSDSDDTVTICHIKQDGFDAPPRGDVMWNGALIAAAPELLKWLRWSVMELEAWMHDSYDGTKYLAINLEKLEPAKIAIARALREI